MKTLTKGILGTVIAVACVYCGYATYYSYIYQQENALLLANGEALKIGTMNIDKLNVKRIKM